MQSRFDSETDILIGGDKIVPAQAKIVGPAFVLPRQFDQFGKQLTAAFACSLYAFVFTWVMLKVIDRITVVRVGEEAERGLDEAMHGESAYEDAPAGVVPAV